MLKEKNLLKIIDDVIRGDRKAAEKFFKYYKKTIRYFLKDSYPKNNDIDDDTSDIIIKIYESLHKYDITKSKFNTWVFNIAKNHMIDKAKKRKISYTNLDYMDVAVDYVDEPHSYHTPPDYQIELESSFNYHYNCLCEEQIQLIEMKNLGYNYKEIGNKFNLSESQVSNKINYAISKIKKEVENF